MERFFCAFTGHRPKSFPWKYNESAPGCVLLKEVLTVQIAELAERGVTDWLSGMALGADLWAAEIVLNLREKNPALTLHCILPCEEQDRKWPTSAREKYRSILERANDTVLLGKAYNQHCMLDRNRYMVDHASVLLAVYNGTHRSGTGATVRYAEKQGKEIFIIDPISRVVTHNLGNPPELCQEQELIHE